MKTTTKAVLAVLALSLWSHQIARGQANNTCAAATAYTCNEGVLAGQTITLTAKDDKSTGDDPSGHGDNGAGTGDKREDVWYRLTIPAGPPQFVEITVTPNVGSGLDLEMGVFTNGTCMNFAELCAWTGMQTLKCCLPEGDYNVVVDESRAHGEDPPAGNGFAFSAICENWTRAASVSMSLDESRCGLLATGLRPYEALAVYMTSGAVMEGQPIPSRLSGSATWVQADDSGELVASDLEVKGLGGERDTNHKASLAPALLAFYAPSGMYSIVLDDGDGIYNASNDFKLGPLASEGWQIPAVSEWGLVVMTFLVFVAGTVVMRRRAAIAS